jgi:ferredoxin-NADP reductase
VAGAAVQRRLSWLVGEVRDLVDEAPGVRSIVFDVPGWAGHRPGQHVDIRLTAEDGYQAQRSYSIATPSDGESVVLTVETVDDGEVSPYLTEVLQPGDQIEIRGPIGGYFVWEPSHGGPVQLIAGGSGIVPLMAMVRAHVISGLETQMRLLGSSRTFGSIIYREELERLESEVPSLVVDFTLTRGAPDDWDGPTRRVDREMLEQLAFPADAAPRCFVCGPTGFVESVATALIGLGHSAEAVKTERFGPTGG